MCLKAFYIQHRLHVDNFCRPPSDTYHSAKTSANNDQNCIQPRYPTRVSNTELVILRF